MTPQETQQKINSEIVQTLKGMAFPEMHMERAIEVGQWVNMAMRHKTAEEMNCDYDTYKVIAATPFDELPMHEIGIALNAVVACNAEQLRCLNMAAYIDIQDEVRRLAGKWNAIVRPLSETIRDKHMKTAAIIKPSNGLIKA